MRISDWSSDVCSSDLPRELRDLDGAAQFVHRPAAGDDLLQPLDHHAHQIEGVRDGFRQNRADRLFHDHALHRRDPEPPHAEAVAERSEEQTSELQSLMRTSYSVFCLKKKRQTKYI